MIPSKKPLAIVAVLGLFLLTAAAPDNAIVKVDTKYSEYLTAIYAREAGDVSRATENYLRVLDKDPNNQKVLEEAFTYFVYVGDFKRALDLAERLQKLDGEHSSSAMLLALEAFKKGKKKAMEKYLINAKGLGFEVLIKPLLEAWILAVDHKPDQAIEVMSGLKDYPGFEPYFAEHRAFILDYAGREDEAEAAYLALLARPEVSSLQPLFAYGAFLQRHGRKDEALDLYNKFQPSAATNLQLKEAISHLEKGKRPETIVDDPTKAMAMALLRTGVQLSREQAYYPGVVYARFALYLDPHFDEGLLFVGNLLSTDPHPGLALAALGQVEEKGPFHETAVLRQAMVYSFHDRRGEGIKLIQDYLADHEETYDALVTLGDLYRSGEDYDKALPFYERAVGTKETLTGDDWFLLFTRGICYERLGRWDEAETDLKKALDFEPDNPDVLNYLGYSWIDRGENLEEGREMIEKAVAADPNNGFIIDSLGWAQYLMGEFDDAVESLERAVSLEPGDPTINDHLGDAYWKVGREREARFQWDHALDLDPEGGEIEKLHKKIKLGLSDPEEPKDNL